MKSWRQLTLIVYFITLCLWIGAIISAAVAAMAVFGTLPGLDVSLGGYEGFAVEGEPDAHGRLASGMILEKVFTGVDFVQVCLAFVVGVLLAIDLMVFRQRFRRAANLVRTVCIVIAIGLLGWHITVQAPEMNRELRRYWDEARAGNVAAALEHRARFNVFHPRAEMVLQANLVLLLVALGASAAAMVPERGSTNAASGRDSNELEPPELGAKRSAARRG